METTETSTPEKRVRAAAALFAVQEFLASEPRLHEIERAALMDASEVLAEYKEQGL